MNLEQYSISESAPSPEEFIRLRVKVGWDSIEPDIARKSLEKSLFHVSVRKGDELIGMGRVLGDGFMYFYIQDVVVDPRFHGKGIGHSLMNSIEDYLSRAAPNGATIGLFAAKGKETFYKPYGFIERNGENLGRGMCRFVRR